MNKYEDLVQTLAEGHSPGSSIIETDEYFEPFSSGVEIYSPFSGREKGVDFLKNTVRRWRKTFHTLSHTYQIERYNEIFIVNWQLECMQVQEFMAIPSVNQLLRYRGETHLIFSEGKIIRYLVAMNLRDFSELLQFNSLEKKSQIIKQINQRLNCSFSSREFECLSLTLGGLTCKQSGAVLSISHRTVESYLYHGLDKLSLTNKKQFLELMIHLDLFSLWLDYCKLILSECSKDKLSQGFYKSIKLC